MAETVKIEIPVSVKDNTAAGVQSASRNMSAFEKSMKKTEQQLNRLDKAHHVRVDANDQASGKIDRLSDSAESLDGMAPDIDVGVSDSASQTLDQISDKAETLDGSAADVDVGANDTATGVINEADDALESFDGSSGDADVGANDTATPVIRAAEDAVENFDGMSGTAEVGASDTASPVIDSVRDKGESWAGSSFDAVIGIVDNATAPLQGILDMLKNPLLQGATILGVSLGAADTVGTYTDFSSMMSQVSAISGATGEELDGLTAKAKEMGATTKFTAAESAEAFNYMAMAGWKTQDMTAGIGGILSLAAASGESLGTTSDIVTDALTAFGLKANSAGHFADVMAQASANANTNVSMLGESFKYVAPIAGAMNYTIEDTSLALGLMANSSIKGSMAGTSLKTAIANMASPTDKMKAAMDKYNLSLTDSDGRMKTLGEVIGDMRTNLGGLSETEQTAAASTIFGKEAMAGMLAIINASEEDYNKLASAINNSTGAADEMADTMLDNLGGSITLLQSALDGVKISLGERVDPYLTDLVQWLTAQMPGVEAGLNSFMDFVDGKVSGVKRTIGSMTLSEEWQNADFFGKVDIAWDKLIAEPFTEWVGSKGADVMSQGLGNLFSSASKIMPGGEKAGLTSWLSAGLIGTGAAKLLKGASSVATALSPIGGAIKNIGLAVKTAPSIGAFVSDLGTMIPAAGKFGLAAAGVTAAVVAIGTAVHNYTQEQKKLDLTEHFGDIALSAREVEAVASGILNAKYLVNVDLAMGAITKADDFAAEAQAALDENKTLTWKSSVGIELTAEERQTYTENIETFVESKISELEERTYAAHIQVQTFLGGTEEGVSLADSIEEWARADHLELSGLSEDLQTAVETALEDGIISVDEAQAVAALQDKMNSITSRWKQAEEEAQMDWITSEYGNLSGKDLEAGAFEDVVKSLSEQRQAASETVEASAKEFYATLNAMEAAGRLTSETNQHYKEIASEAIRNQQANDLMTSLSFETNTLNDTYGEALQSNFAKTQSNMEAQLSYLSNYVQNGDIGSMIQSMSMGNNFTQQGGGWDWTQSATQNNLDDLWATMKPDATAMTEMLDEYVNMGQAIPRQVMDSFNEAMQIGAASGDTDAAWQVYANSIAQSGDEALKSAVNEMVDNGQLPEEFNNAWKRATAEITDEPVELEGLKAEVNGDVDVNKDEWLQKIQANLDEGNIGTITAETDAEIEVTVDKGDCLSQIGEAVGMDWKEIAAYNGIEEPYTIYPDMTIKIPKGSIDVDSSETQAALSDAVQTAISSLESEGNVTEVSGSDIEVTLGEVTVNEGDALEKVASAVGMTVDELASYNGIEPGEVDVGMKIRIPVDQIEVDSSELNAAVDQTVAEASAVEPAEVDATANVTVEAESVDTSNVEGSAQEALDSAEGTASATMSADVTVDAASVDSSSAVEATQTDLDSQFSQEFPAEGTTGVTITKASDNIAKVYSQVGSELQAAFNSPYSASATVNVTVAYHITNPTASISTSSSGSTVTTSIAGHASGGEVGTNGPELSWLGEEGLEYVIPTVPGRKQRGIELWRKAGRTLGVLGADGEISAHANGGIVGAGSNLIPEDSYQFGQVEKDDTVWSVLGRSEKGDSNRDASEGEGTEISLNAMPNESGNGESNVEVNVTMNPVIKIEGGNMDEEKIFEVLQSRIREMADELGDEIAERMGKIFNNMPTVQEA
ncbi:MAG: phage tail tape measure protein [Eubacteriales bacterium]|nr:phage tail tape measure protein [Eubacteriales bacterium]